MPKFIRLIILIAFVWPHTSFAQATKRIKHAAAQQLCLSNTVSSANKDGVCVSATGAASFPNGTNLAKLSAYRTSSVQTINAATWTQVQLNGETFDTASAFDPNTTYRFTVPRTGYYYLYGQVRFDNMNGGKPMSVRFMRNSTMVAYNLEYSAATNEVFAASTAIISATAGDLLEMQAYQGDTGVRNIQVGFDTSFFNVVELP